MGMGMISYSPDTIPIGDPVSNCDIAVNLKIFTNKLAKTKKALENNIKPISRPHLSCHHDQEVSTT